MTTLGPPERFTLRPRLWYAAELIGDEFGETLRSYSPIRVDAITPEENGSRRFRLAFYHANYPEGVRDKVYSLETIERSKRFLLARSADHSPARIILVYDICWSWLRTKFGIQAPDESLDVADWLASHA